MAVFVVWLMASIFVVETADPNLAPSVLIEQER